MNGDNRRQLGRVCVKIAGERHDHFANPRVVKIYAGDPGSLERRMAEAALLAEAGELLLKDADILDSRETAKGAA